MSVAVILMEPLLPWGRRCINSTGAASLFVCPNARYRRIPEPHCSLYNQALPGKAIAESLDQYF
jgi:hypothetical protein